MKLSYPYFQLPLPSYTLVVISLDVSISLTVVICVRLCAITHESAVYGFYLFDAFPCIRYIHEVWQFAFLPLDVLRSIQGF